MEGDNLCDSVYESRLDVRTCRERERVDVSMGCARCLFLLSFCFCPAVAVWISFCGLILKSPFFVDFVLMIYII